MKTQKFRYIIIFLSIVILGYRLYFADYSDFWSLKNLLNLSVPLLLIISMVLSIRHTYRNQES